MGAIEMQKTVTLADGTSVKVTMRRRNPPGSSRGSSVKEWRKATRVYVDEVGETMLDNLERRWGRPHKMYKPAVLEALEAVGVRHVKVRWSQRAGCSCPCSPGFILCDMSNKVKRWRAEDGFTALDITIAVGMGSLGESMKRFIFTEDNK